MASFPTRRVIAAAASVAGVVAVPAVAILAGVSGATPGAVAQCPGNVNMNILQEGVPVASNCAAPVTGPQGGAPSEGLLSGCSGIPGCLSNALYGPGNVQVPQRSTRVQQSQ